MCDLAGIARIGQTGGQMIDQTELSVEMAQPQNTAVRGDLASVEICDNVSFSYGREGKAFVTLCHGRCSC